MLKILSFHSCNDLSVSKLKITNSPGGHIAINGCYGAKFSNLVIDSPPNSPNTDGFDISASKNILIEDSTIQTGNQSQKNISYYLNMIYINTINLIFYRCIYKCIVSQS